MVPGLTSAGFHGRCRAGHSSATRHFVILHYCHCGLGLTTCIDTLPARLFVRCDNVLFSGGAGVARRASDHQGGGTRTSAGSHTPPAAGSARKSGGVPAPGGGSVLRTSGSSHAAVGELAGQLSEVRLKADNLEKEKDL
jgi:hypothetical protein